MEGGEPHPVITGLDSLGATIQPHIVGEEIGEGSLYRIERGTHLVALTLTLLYTPTEGTGKSPSHAISKLLFLTMG